MQLLRKFRKDRLTSSINRARPGLEELELRHLPSAASFNVAVGIVGSPESLQDLVTNDYQTFLHRAPDPGGLTAWTQALENGLSPAQVEASLASSSEYINEHGGTAGATWLSSLYQDFLNRAPDQTGFNSWMNQLANGAAPFNVAFGFASSAERDAIVIANAYQQFLGRQPDAGGAASWLNQMENGLTQIGLNTALVGSDEFFLRSGSTDQNFIVSAYQKVLGRTPSDAEIGPWLTAMGDSSSLGSASGQVTPPQQIVTFNLNPIDINALGLEIQTNAIQVTVSAQKGPLNQVGNLISDDVRFTNLASANSAVNAIATSVVSALNSGTVSVQNVNTATGPLSSRSAATVPVFSMAIAPVHTSLQGAIVDTSAIQLTITAHAGQGAVLANAFSDFANAFNNPSSLASVNTQLQQLIQKMNQQFQGIASAPTSPTPLNNPGFSITVPSIMLNLEGLVLNTGQFQVNATATGNTGPMGNVFAIPGATPQGLQTLSANINAIMAKMVGVLDNATLSLAAGQQNQLRQALQSQGLPDLTNTYGTSIGRIVNLAIPSTDGSIPPATVNLLGEVVATSSIQAQLVAQTGTQQVLANVLLGATNILLNPDGSLNLLTYPNEQSL